MDDKDTYKFPRLVLTNVVLLAVGFQMAAMAIGQRMEPPKAVDIQEIVLQLRTKPVAAMKAPEPLTNSPYARKLHEVRQNYISADQQQAAAETTLNINYIRVSNTILDRLAQAKPAAQTDVKPEESPVLIDDSVVETPDVAEEAIICLKPKSVKKDVGNTAKGKQPPAPVGKDVEIHAQAEKYIKKITPQIKAMAQKPNAQRVYRGYTIIEKLTAVDKNVMAMISYDETKLGTHQVQKGRKPFKKNLLEIKPRTIVDYIRWNGGEASDILRKERFVFFEGSNYCTHADNLKWLADTLNDRKSLTNDQLAIIKSYENNFLVAGFLTALQAKSSQDRLSQGVPQLSENVKKAIPTLQHKLGDGSAAKLLKSSPDVLVSKVLKDYELENFPFLSSKDTAGEAREKIAAVFNMGAKVIEKSFNDAAPIHAADVREAPMLPVPGYIQLAAARVNAKKTL